MPKLSQLCQKLAQLSPSAGPGELCVSQKAWGGRFAAGTDRRVEEFTESISFDRRLFKHDIQGSVAHARMLQRVGLLVRS